MSLPVNEDKSLARKDLLPKVTGSRHAHNADDLDKTLEDWETSKRLFEEAGSSLPDQEQEMLTFIDILPPDLSASVLMHMEMTEDRSYEKIKEVRLALREGSPKSAPQAQDRPQPC